ncbi:MAG: bifunctional oligoribonuclease/PAP phosphatase NrnA [Actinomycetota bacterium]
MTEQLKRAAEVLDAASDVALACHINPDPDALGSMLGLATFLRTRDKKVVASFGNSPFEPPRWLEALEGADVLVPPERFPKAPEVMVTLDCASLDRLGSLVGPSQKAKELVWIDHHVSNDGLGTVPLIDPKASSTAEMVFRLMRCMGGDIPASAAACLYAGVVTDTGRFQYEATSPETLRLAAELRTLDFDHARLAQALFEDNSMSYLRVLATALGRLRLVEGAGGGLVWTYLTQEDVAEAGISMAETDDLIDVIRSAREADVAAVLKQQRDGRFKVSMRSRGGHDVSKVAAERGGGGHRLASGYTAKGSVEDAVRDLESGLETARTPA